MTPTTPPNQPDAGTLRTGVDMKAAHRTAEILKAPGNALVNEEEIYELVDAFLKLERDLTACQRAQIEWGRQNLSLTEDLAAANKKIERMKELGKALTDRMDALSELLDDVFVFYQAHGMRWNQEDNYVKEFAALRDELEKE